LNWEEVRYGNIEKSADLSKEQGAKNKEQGAGSRELNSKQ